ncbi:VUT family protein [Actinosynnema sp. NPDC050436]|uniref:VUT family protein n=1 Tax=Actinosynnema sp. NPDC050436 TaxID=3155659 RepID=UPI0033E22FBA
MTGYLLSVLAANLASTAWPAMLVAGMSVPAGTLFAGMGLTVRDLLHETLGTRGVAMGIVTAAGLSAVLTTPQLAVACLVAFTASEVLDTLVYARLRRHTRFGALAVSNAVGLMVDSVLFVPLAFGGFAALPGQILGKTLATVLTLAVLHGTRVARREARP